MPFNREERRIQNSKQDKRVLLNTPPSSTSMLDGDESLAILSNKQLAHYIKQKGILWHTYYTRDGNQYVDKDLEVKGNTILRNNLTVNGNAGIGASDPGSLLEVRGGIGTGFTGAGQLTLSTAELTIVDNDILGVLAFQAPKETGADAILPSAAIWGESEATFDASNNDTALVFATANSETVLATAQERMRIDSSGNVGIGEIAPEGNLHISSLTDATIILEADTDDTPEGDNPRIELRQDGNGVNGYLGITGAVDSLYTGSLANTVYLESKNKNSANSNIQFVTGGDLDDDNDGTVRMTIRGTGQVGIGTNAPSANADLTLESGVLNLKETTTPTADTNYGKIYTKNDNKLYFQDGEGNEYTVDITAV